MHRDTIFKFTFMICLFAYFFAGLAYTPITTQKMIDYRLRLIEKGQFSKFNWIAKYTKPLPHELIIDKLLISYKKNEISEIVNFIKKITHQKEYEGLFNSNNILRLVKTHVTRETFVILKILTPFLDKGVDLNLLDSNGFHLAHHAVGNLEIFSNDLDKGFPLLFTSKDLIQTLMSKGVSFDIEHSELGITPLMISSYFGDSKAVELLLNSGVKSDTASSLGKNARDYVKKGRKDFLSNTAFENTSNSSLFSIKIKEFDTISNLLKGVK